MQTTTITCDCCGNEMEEPNDSVLEGLLVDAMVNPIEMEDLCEPCSEALADAINTVLLRRQAL